MSRAEPPPARTTSGSTAGSNGTLLGVEDLLGELAHHRRRHEPERVVVRPRPDRRDDLVRLGGREDELQVRRRLLDELEQGVEALLGHHVRLVDDVDLVAAGDRRVEGTLPQVAGVVHAAVAGRVDLDHVDAARPGRGERDARVADAARVGRRAVHAVQRPGQDARAGRLAAAARAAEQVGVVDPAAAQRLAERLGDVLLAADFGEGGGAVLAVQGQGLPGGRALGVPVASESAAMTSSSQAKPVGTPRIRRGSRGTSPGEKERTPRAPVRARVPLLPSGPGGVGEVNAARGVGR